MTVEREEPGHRNGQKLDDIVQDADEYYNYLKEKRPADPARCDHSQSNGLVRSIRCSRGRRIHYNSRKCVDRLPASCLSRFDSYCHRGRIRDLHIQAPKGVQVYRTWCARSEGEAGWSLVRGWTPLDGRDAPGSVCSEEEKAHISLGVWDRRIRNRHHTRIERGSRRIGWRHRISLLQIRGVERVLAWRGEIREFEEGIAPEPLIRLGASRPVCPRPIPGHTLRQSSLEEDESADETRSKLSTFR